MIVHVTFTCCCDFINILWILWFDLWTNKKTHFISGLDNWGTFLMNYEVQSNFLVSLKLFLNANIPYPYEVNGKLVTGNGSLIPIFSLSNSSLMPSLTVPNIQRQSHYQAITNLYYATMIWPQSSVEPQIKEGMYVCWFLFVIGTILTRLVD